MANPIISLTLKRLDEVLSRKSTCQLKSSRHVERSWQILAEVMLPQLTEAAFEAEDIIDNFNLMPSQKKKRSGFGGSLVSILTCVGKRSARHQLVGESASFASAAPRGTSELQKAALSGGLSVVGFAEAERSMSEQLLNGELSPAVISVVGMGGMGKTTIAKKNYNSYAVKRHFQRRVWVTVSQKFTPTELLQRILDCVLGTTTEKEIRSLTDMQLGERLRALLENVRYLVVMDDIWEKGAWGLIKCDLPASPGTELPLLSEENWELFCAKVLPAGERCPPELEKMGKEMVRRCRGMPRAVLVLGGLVSERERTRYEWEALRRRLTQELSADTNEMIDATKLVQLWVAEGFIQQANGLTLEETAERHLEELANRSVFQVVDRDYMGWVDRFRIHNLLLHLAKDEGRRNQFNDNASVWLSSSSSFAPNLRSLLCLNLRDQELGDSLLNLLSLKHLRNGASDLGLRGTSLASLPSSIDNLCKLQTLDISCVFGVTLPRALTELQMLNNSVAGAWVEAGLRKLSNLRSLAMVDISEAHVKPLAEAIQMRLKRLNFLQLIGSCDHVGLHELILNGPTRKVGGLVAGNLPQNLTAITLIGCRLEQDPPALLEGLPVLEKLRLGSDAFVGDEMICSATGFKLRELVIDGISLVSFTIVRCPLLESLPEGMEGMWALKELILKGMHAAFTENGADWSKIRHIPPLMSSDTSTPSIYLGSEFSPSPTSLLTFIWLSIRSVQILFNYHSYSREKRKKLTLLLRGSKEEKKSRRKKPFAVRKKAK
ncbi:unnamed protein product [Spirodela intermedia]|uniref:Uncharacterized protein n=1 Tax=Spirodela intermedia TaxID=51605 RepID=A0A7I8JEG1_SPIIN|nr:unnamed protein product [Spirodela intermedia]CAA6668489.1 unnamed protein product [Spirodela intermedia]